MSYLGISVKEAINSINNGVNGWFLPAIQRPYVWGSRYENELYICKLFDSILKGYPIGGLIIWNTEEPIPYREFIKDYLPGELPKLVDKGLHGRKDKWLIYDGQQRLQTLYSCLKHTFNEKGSPQVLMEKNFHFTAPLDCHIQLTTVKEDPCSIAFEASKPSGRSL